LLPGTLQHNNSQKYICKNVHIVPQSKSSLICNGLDADRALKIPIAHGEGRYFDFPEAIKRLNDNDQVIFRYSDEKGRLTDDANPNGSIENIAGVTNATKNVFGMMPHPERASESIVNNVDGLMIMEALLSMQTA